MTDPSGSFALVLHGHLPWVLHHGYWPHGEVWLYEAAAESWMPLLAMVRRCRADGVPCPLTIGLTPVLQWVLVPALALFVASKPFVKPQK